MDKNKKILLIISICIIVAIVAVLLFIFLPDMFEKQYEDVYLEEMVVSKSLENVTTEYVDDQVTAFDEQGRKINYSEVLPLEKFILDNKVGMYDFRIMSDVGDSTLTFILKNHTKEKVEAFKYRLQLVDSMGGIIGTIDLDGKELPSLAKYKVTVNVDSDIADVYDIIPVTDF